MAHACTAADAVNRVAIVSIANRARSGDGSDTMSNHSLSVPLQPAEQRRYNRFFALVVSIAIVLVATQPTTRVRRTR